MIEIALQSINGKPHLFSEEDREKWAEYRENQVVKARCVGAKKPRSYKQLKLYWSACGIVAENMEDRKWSTKDSVDFQLRVALDFRDPHKVAVSPSGDVQFFYRSIAFANLGHIEACNYFDRAFDLMAKKLGVTKDALMQAIAERGA